MVLSKQSRINIIFANKVLHEVTNFTSNQILIQFRYDLKNACFVRKMSDKLTETATSIHGGYWEKLQSKNPFKLNVQ